MQICIQIGLKMEAGDCPTLNMNAMENYLLSHSLNTFYGSRQHLTGTVFENQRGAPTCERNL